MQFNFKNFYGDPLTIDALKFFFIFCPNNSGTTVMSQYLSSQVNGYLPPFGNNEGQMAPAVRKMMRNRPWSKDQRFDWFYIRKHWEGLAEGKIFVEASPPNLIRLQDIKPVFGKDSSALISICNPYQQVASCLRRYSGSPNEFARSWIFKANSIINILKENPCFPFVSYEDFVENPTIINKKLGLSCCAVKILGKHGSDIKEIRSAYCRGIGFLKVEEVVSITEVFAGSPEVLDFFGYALAGPEILDDARERNFEEFTIGLEVRRLWDRRLTDH
jgi:hypothetical protein